MNPLAMFIGGVCGAIGAFAGIFIANKYAPYSDGALVAGGFGGMLVTFLVVGVPVILWLTRAGVM